MAMQLGALRTALLEAGATQDKADNAAEEAAAAGYETRLNGLETKVSVVTWMVGANITLTILTFGVLMTLASNLGEISGQMLHLSH